MERQQIHETKQKMFSINKQIEANEKKLKVLQYEREYLAKPELQLDCDTYKNHNSEVEQQNINLAQELRACKRQMEVAKEETDELLRNKKVRYEEEKLVEEEACLLQDCMQQLKAVKTERDELKISKAEIVQQFNRQLKAVETERDELKTSNKEMAHQLEERNRLKLTEKERSELKAITVQITKRNVKPEKQVSEVELHVKELSKKLEASETQLGIYQTEQGLLKENISLLKRQVSMMQDGQMDVCEIQRWKWETTVNHLPFELLDMILQKSYVLCLRNRNHSTLPRKQDIIHTLASVDFCWFQRTIKPRFRRGIWGYCTVFYRKTGVRNAIYRNNQSYLEQDVRAKDLTRLLRSVDCLTDVQVRQLSRGKPGATVLHDKNRDFEFSQEKQNTRERRYFDRKFELELLHYMKSVDATRYSAVISCFRQSSHMLTARLAENGGVAVKVELVMPDAGGQILNLVDRLSNLRNKNILRLFETDRLISWLKSNGIEILKCRDQCRHAEVWFWCQLQKSVTKLLKLKESNALISVLEELSNIPFRPFKMIKVNIDMDQCKKEIVSQSTVPNFVCKLDLQAREQVVGVTKLQNEILVICRTPETVICVFTDQNPFNLQKITELREILWPEDTVSNQKEKCVYVSDKENECIWKITSETDDHCTVVKWSDAGPPFTMSVSSDDRLVMARECYPSSILKICGSQGELHMAIKLPRDIQKPCHAVETTTGNFVILHDRIEEEEFKEQEDCTSHNRKMELCISLLTRDGQNVIHRFTALNQMQQLGIPYHLALDSDDRVLVADHWNYRMILLNANLTWNQTCPIQCQNDQRYRPRRFYYDEVKKQLIIAGTVSMPIGGVNVYVLSWK